MLTENSVQLTLSSNADSPYSSVVIARLADRCADLLPAELPLLEGRSPRRREEFSSGRYCARRAMAARGLPAAAVLSSKDRSPVWPDGLRGSLTHSRKLVGAGVSASLQGLGIDLEHFDRLSQRAAERVLTDEEIESLGTSDSDFLHQATIVFSAKESVYKAIYPTAGVYIGYREVLITLDPEGQAFSACYVGPNGINTPLDAGVGHWWVVEDAVLTRFEIGGRP